MLVIRQYADGVVCWRSTKPYRIAAVSEHQKALNETFVAKAAKRHRNYSRHSILPPPFPAVDTAETFLVPYTDHANHADPHHPSAAPVSPDRPVV
jgi:hypothetical protein